MNPDPNAGASLPKADATVVSFDHLNLTPLRHALAAQVAVCGLAGHALDDFILAVNEIAANAVTHGGGGDARLRLWCEGDQLRCEISDDGPGLADERPTGGQVADLPPPLLSERGRGLWLARQLCGLAIDSGPLGTTVGIATTRPAPGRTGLPVVAPTRPAPPLLCRRCLAAPDQGGDA